MTAKAVLPQREPRISDEQTQEIYRLCIQQVSQAEIARRVGVQRKTVRRVEARMSAMLAPLESVENERAKALATYREIQRVAWEQINTQLEKDQPKGVLGLMAEIRLAQKRIDDLLGLEPVKAVAVGLLQGRGPTAYEPTHPWLPSPRERLEMQLRSHQSDDIEEED